MSTLLVVDDDRSIIRVFQRCFEQTDIAVISAASGAEALKAMSELQPDVVVLDILLPDQSGLSVYEGIRRQNPAIPILFVTGSGTSDTAIESMRLGAMDYLSKPLDMVKIREVIGQAMAISDLMRVTVARNGSENGNAASPAGATSSDALIGHCPTMLEVYKAIGRVTGQHISVLVRGESGTGKELVARAIHQHSARAGRKFLAVNCAAIPESLLESELFGHEKGSFTGAVSQRIGKFEECDGGTLFLDEVGDMPLLMQSKVLRTIQEKEFQRVGGNQTIKSDVCIVAATNRDLEAMVAGGQFRADLCYRLNGYTIPLPPLRERRDDIPLLVDYYLRRFNAEIGKAISGVARDAMERLKQYSWPGNIRELQTVLKHAMLHAIGPILQPEFLPSELREDSLSSPRPPRVAIPTDANPATHGTIANSPSEEGDFAFNDFREFIVNHLHEGTDSLYADCVKYMECILLTEVLSYTDGNQSQAALLLGITRGCLRSKLRTHGIMIHSSVAIH
ncbi:MAG: sigma-54-dependent transcriptional regulator [Thermoguttaceae bacterium]